MSGVDLTFFQKERLQSLAAEMNFMAKQDYSIENLFMSYADDGTVLSPGEGYQGNEETYNTVMKIYEPQINIILEKKNPLKNVGEKTIALLLWNIPGVFRYTNKNHFKLKNTTKSPVYFNLREPTKRPNAMNIITGFFQMECEYTCKKPDVLVGGELAGVYYADRWGKDIHTRVATARKPKGHGIHSKIDGKIYEGDIAHLVEDLITDAGSKFPFINGIREAGGEVKDVFVVFDREQGGGERLLEAGVALHSSVTRTYFLSVGEEGGRINEDAIADIEVYFEDSKQWNLDHGYKWNPR